MSDAGASGKEGGGRDDVLGQNKESSFQELKKQQLEREKTEAERLKQEAEAKKAAEKKKQQELQQQKDRLQEQKLILEKIEKTLGDVREKFLSGNMSIEDIVSILSNIQKFLSSLPREVINQLQTFLAKIYEEIAKVLSLLSKGKSHQGVQGAGGQGDGKVGQNATNSGAPHTQDDVQKRVSELLTSILEQTHEQKRHVEDEYAKVNSQIESIENTIAAIEKEIAAQQDLIATKEKELQQIADEELERRIQKELEEVFFSCINDLKKLAGEIVRTHSIQEIQEKVATSSLFKEVLQKVEAKRDESNDAGDVAMLEKYFDEEERKEEKSEVDAFSDLRDKVPPYDYQRIEGMVRNLRNILNQRSIHERNINAFIRVVLAESIYAFTKRTSEIGIHRTPGGVEGLKNSYMHVIDLLTRFMAKMPTWLMNVFTSTQVKNIKPEK